jgi:hypothetical protein
LVLFGSVWWFAHAGCVVSDVMFGYEGVWWLMRFFLVQFGGLFMLV